MGSGAATGPAMRWALGLAAVVLLNLSVTFVSVWPTLAVRPVLALSADAASVAGGLALAWHWRRKPFGRGLLRALAILWCGLVVARYAEVTTRALYGRSVNLYWDLTLLPDVGAMFAAVADPRVLLALAAALVAVPLLLYSPIRWAVGAVQASCAMPSFRYGAMAAAVVVLAVGPLVRRSADEDVRRIMPSPVAESVTREALEFVRDAWGGHSPLPPPPSFDSDLAYVRGADVAILFIESYGVTSWERPEFAAALQPARAGLIDAITATGQAVVTARVESTTFGGESWLAHISLLSGTEVRDQATNRRLMAERRDTLVTTFGRAGYRTFGVFPGLHSSWPEGRFYGFERILTSPDLGYRGPPFGWWDLTDQFVLARVDEITRADAPGAPHFVFLPTISTHTPFTPVPPYQPDWERVLTAAPYDEATLLNAYEATPDWTDLGPAYVRALAYLHETLAGYLRRHADRDLVLVVIGDHQPPALVSGEGASWEVPMHVITRRATVLERLRARGFRDGLEPSPAVLARMDGLMPILLDAFGNTGQSGASGAARTTARRE